MTNKKKILVIQKVHDKGMELINNHPNFDVEVTDDVSIEKSCLALDEAQPGSTQSREIS